MYSDSTVQCVLGGVHLSFIGVARGGGPGVPVTFRTLSGYVCFEILKNKWDKLEGPCFRFQTLKTAIKPPVLCMNN